MTDPIPSDVLKIANRYSGRNALIKNKVGDDLGIHGNDAVEFYREVEQIYNVDLRPVTENRIERINKRWWQSKYEVRGTDPTIEEIIKFIESQLR